MALSMITWIFNYESMNLHMNIRIVVDELILKLIYEPNIICIVVDNIFLVDNAHKLIYECVLFCSGRR